MNRLKFYRKKRLILLDIDDTLFRCDTFVAFIVRYITDYSAAKFLLIPWLVFLALLFKAGIISNVTLKENTLRVIAGESRASLVKRSERFIDGLFARKLNRKVFEILKKMTASGLYDVIIISASPSFYIELIGRRINALYTIATDLVFDESDLLQPVIKGRNCKGEEKIVRLKEIINLEDYDLLNSYAFSDSITDIPMLELVGRPVAVTPDSALHELAVKNNYIIIK